MKKLLILIPAFLFCVWNSKAQTNVYHPFPDSNATWNVFYNGGFSCYYEDFSYTFNGDTVIGNFNYHKLFTPYVQPLSTCGPLHPSGYNGCIRQDTSAREVFYITPGDSIEELLYDFNLQVGDSVHGSTRFNCTTITVAVTEVDSILIGTDFRKRWTTGGVNPYNYIIEGIGFTSGPLEGCPYSPSDIPYYSLQCFQQNGITLFPDTNTNCMLIDVHSEIPIPQSEILFSPNPLCSQLSLHFPSPQNTSAQLKIFNSIGEAVLEKEIMLQDQTLNLAALPQGIYLVSVMSKGSVYNQKIVK